jgi:hypothetical protein
LDIYWEYHQRKSFLWSLYVVYFPFLFDTSFLSGHIIWEHRCEWEMKVGYGLYGAAKTTLPRFMAFYYGPSNTFAFVCHRLMGCVPLKGRRIHILIAIWDTPSRGAPPFWFSQPVLIFLKNCISHFIEVVTLNK